MWACLGCGCGCNTSHLPSPSLLLMEAPQDKGPRLAPQPYHNPPHSSHNCYASALVEVHPSEDLPFTYCWLPCPAVTRDKEGSIEDQIRWVFTQHSLEVQVAVHTQGISHFQAFADIYCHCTKLKQSTHVLCKHVLAVGAPTEQRRLAKDVAKAM